MSRGLPAAQPCGIQCHRKDIYITNIQLTHTSSMACRSIYSVGRLVVHRYKRSRAEAHPLPADRWKKDTSCLDLTARCMSLASDEGAVTPFLLPTVDRDGQMFSAIARIDAALRACPDV